MSNDDAPTEYGGYSDRSQKVPGGSVRPQTVSERARALRMAGMRPDDRSTVVPASQQVGRSFNQG